MYTLFTHLAQICIAICTSYIFPPGKDIYKLRGNPSAYIADHIIILQVSHILFFTNLSYLASLILPGLLLLLLKTVLDSTNTITIKQKQCIITFIHGLLIMLLGSYTLLAGYIPNIAYYIIGFSNFYLLYDSITSYTSDDTKFLDYRLTMVIHHILTMITIEHIIDFNELGKMVLVAYTFIECSNIPHWYSYFLINSKIKEIPSPYLVILDSFMFIIIRSFVAYYVFFNPHSQLDIYIVGVINLLASWIWGYNLLMSLYVVE